MTIKQIPKKAITFTTITPDTHEKYLGRNPTVSQDMRYGTERKKKIEAHTSLILDFKNGFLMYQVEFKNVRAKMRSSVFPESSKLSGDALQNNAYALEI